MIASALIEAWGGLLLQNRYDGEVSTPTRLGSTSGGPKLPICRTPGILALLPTSTRSDSYYSIASSTCATPPAWGYPD